MKKLGIMLFGLVFLFGMFSLTSAQSEVDGLTVQGDGNFSINFTEGDSYDIDLTLVNENTQYTMENVSFESNSQLSMSETTFNPGESKNVTITATGSSDFSEEFRIKGWYEDNQGPQNENHNVDIENFDTEEQSISPCQVSGVKGDSVTFSNNIGPEDSVEIINADNNQEMASIPHNSSEQIDFSNEQVVNYYAVRSGIQFTDICSISMTDTQGFVNDPLKDAVINVDADVNHEPTDISLEVLTDEYSLRAGESVEDILKVENTGNQTAQNIVLNGEWFSSFSVNNFNLEPGESQNVGYTIMPSISNTNETNQSYTKNLSVMGNFEDVSHEFDVFVEHTNLQDSDSGSTQSFEERMRVKIDDSLSYCESNPNFYRCPDVNEQVSVGEGGSGESNITINDRQFRNFMIDLRGDLDSLQDSGSVEREIQSEDLEITNSSLRYLESLNKTLSEVKEDSESGDSSGTFFAVVVLGIGVIGYMVYRIHRHKKSKLKQNYEDNG